ncbi:expressed unknown protein [Seminavis robusta]|uniref:Uncharacterized protein n=1 Tax=Seminavis robusta TaxID=568900 RepID=A0A9N8E6I4_9STRA|nr:expressed unknown protein [Seminavis robusta]|eukprot:Sro549_g164540.1 n/a (399) ;mRNA; r:14201-15483
MNPHQQPTLELGDSDVPSAAPVQRLDVSVAAPQQLSRAQALLIPPSRQHELLSAVLSVGRPVGAEEAKSPTGSRPNSPPQDRRNPPQLKKALSSWNAARQSQSAELSTAAKKPPMGGTCNINTGRAKPSSPGRALSFVMQRAQEVQRQALRTNPKANATVDASVVQALRRNMREELLKRLTKSKLGSGNSNMAKQSPEVQAAFARRLEEVLFKTSKSVEAYADSTTLDRRLKMLLAAMQNRKAKKEGGTGTLPAAAAPQPQKKAALKPGEMKRREALRKTLGQVKMNRVFKVMAEIKLIQLGREVTEGKPYEPIPMCTKGGCSFSVPCPGDQKAPKVVRDLFFNTAIIAAYEKSSVALFPSLPWDALLAQGEARLAAYHEWYRQRQAAKNSRGFASMP